MNLSHTLPLTVTDLRVVPGDGAFLIDDGQTAVLYDTGFGFTGYGVADKVREVLGDRALDYILLTHSHYDHALGSAYLRRRYPNVRVVAGTYAQRIFQKPSARELMGEMDKKAAAVYGITAYEAPVDELRVDIPVEDGDHLQCGRMHFTTLSLPGHTKCSVGYYLAENRLLLAPETLGVYCGEGVFLPSFLVGYQMTLDSIQKARKLDIQNVLLPHYGLVSGEEAQCYLSKSEEVTQEVCTLILDLLKAGKSKEEIFAHITDRLYTDRVKPAYPYDAYKLNSEIMIELIRKELLSPA